MTRTARSATLTAVISALLLALSPQALTPAGRAQNSGCPQSRMYCVGFAVSDHLYRVDNYATAPTAVDLGSTGQHLTDIAITPSGVGYAITVSDLYRIDLESGKTTAVRKNLFPASQNSLEAASDDLLYVWGSGDRYIRRIKLTPQSAELDKDWKIDPGRYGADLALVPGGMDLYGTTLDGHLIKVNLVTRAVTDIALTGISTEPLSGLGFASDGQLYATRGSNKTRLAQVYRIDVCTGKATPVGETGDIVSRSQLGNAGMAMRR